MINNEQGPVELAKNQLRTEVKRYVKDYVAQEISKVLLDEYEYTDEQDMQVPAIELKNSSGVFVTPSTTETFGIAKIYTGRTTTVTVRGQIVDENEDVDGWEIKYWEIIE